MITQNKNDCCRFFFWAKWSRTSYTAKTQYLIQMKYVLVGQELLLSRTLLPSFQPTLPPLSQYTWAGHSYQSIQPLKSAYKDPMVHQLFAILNHTTDTLTSRKVSFTDNTWALTTGSTSLIYSPPSFHPRRTALQRSAQSLPNRTTAQRWAWSDPGF